MRYKTGDEVIISLQGEWKQRYNSMTENGKDKFFRLASTLNGKVVRIIDAGMGTCLIDADHGRWVWFEEMFQPIPAPDMEGADSLI